MVQQAADRSHSYIRDIDSYLEVRRETVAAKPAFALLELGMDLPDEIITHPIIQDLSIWAIDMLSLSNVRPFCRLVRSDWCTQYIPGHRVVQSRASARR